MDRWGNGEVVGFGSAKMSLPKPYHSFSSRGWSFLSSFCSNRS
jgi:hypothetical protein